MFYYNNVMLLFHRQLTYTNRYAAQLYGMATPPHMPVIYPLVKGNAINILIYNS
jgi:hypothetical protein